MGPEGRAIPRRRGSQSNALDRQTATLVRMSASLSKLSMKPGRRRPCVLLGLLGIWAAAGLPSPLLAAETSQEQKLIQVLESESSAREKDAACVQLKRIGTAQCVPALSALLLDEQLSHSARYVLEAMSAPQA